MDSKARNEYQRNRFAAMPPAKCHPERKEHAGGWCRSCYRTKGKRAARAACHPERLQVAKGLCQQCYNDLPANKAMRIRTRRLKKYGLTEAQYKAILERQGDQCAICGGKPDAVDHCHKNKKVRGILCKLCNTGLGHFEDNPKLLRAAANYLEQNE